MFGQIAKHYTRLDMTDGGDTTQMKICSFIPRGGISQIEGVALADQMHDRSEGLQNHTQIISLSFYGMFKQPY